MTHEDYVSFEQAQRLKELGFNWDCMKGYAHYPNENVKAFNAQEENINGDYNKWTFSAPSLAQAQRWLREVKGCKILITEGDINKENYGWEFRYKDTWLGDISHGNVMETYEEALADAIDEALDILEKGESV